MAAAAACGQILGLDRGPFGIVKTALPGVRLDVVRRLVLGQRFRYRLSLDDLRLHGLPPGAKRRRSLRRHQIDGVCRRKRRRHDRSRRRRSRRLSARYRRDQGNSGQRRGYGEHGEIGFAHLILLFGRTGNPWAA